MPKITKHGGPTIYQDTESFIEALETLGESEVKEVSSSVGDNSLKSSKRMPTIEEILGIDHP